MDVYKSKKCDNLQDIWKDQLDFTMKVIPCAPEEMTPEQRQYWTEKYLMLMNKEAFEVLDETEFKPHRKIKGNITRSNIVEELIDVFKYFMCVCQVQGVTAEELMEEYHRKSNVVLQRFHQEKVLTYENKIAGIDIDGILADYPRSFVEFINQAKGTNFDYRNVKEYNIAEELGLSTEEICRYKHEYRDTGAKRFVPVIDGAKQFLDELKYMGYTVVLLTSRPVDKYKRIFADTQYWLAENKLHYDAILFDEWKGERLIKEFGRDKVEFFVDDVAGFANGISEAGLKCYLMRKTYNESAKIKDNVVRVNTLEDVLKDRRQIQNDKDNT